MADTLLVWPPGLPVAEWRYNVLRRQRYCLDLIKCAHTDIRCCCNTPAICCCETLVMETEDDWRLDFEVTSAGGHISCSGHLNYIQGGCDWQGTSPTEFDCVGVGDCNILELQEMKLYCPEGKTDVLDYLLDITVDTLCADTTTIPVKTSASCGLPPFLQFDVPAVCEEGIDCPFTVTFSTSPYIGTKRNTRDGLPEEVNNWLSG